MNAGREGMLRPEFQDWYPSLQAGRWYPADELTSIVLDHLQHGSPHWRPIGRVPSDVHFEFRGGVSKHRSATATRSTDRPAWRSGGSAPTAGLDS
jgi:hypothetical protein